MNDRNMEIWESVGTTDPRYTKKVNDGRHEFTAIDAYYQIMLATNLWGPYGDQWGLRAIERHFHEELCVIDAEFYYPLNGKIVYFEIGNAIKWVSQKGVPDGDFMKKLETNTISKSLSRLGFSSDVYLGKFDDDRYVAGVYDELVFIDRSQVAILNGLLEETKTDLGKFNAYFKISKLSHMQREDFAKAITFLEAKKAEVKPQKAKKNDPA